VPAVPHDTLLLDDALVSRDVVAVSPVDDDRGRELALVDGLPLAPCVEVLVIPWLGPSEVLV